jgi:hypothetical protein
MLFVPMFQAGAAFRQENFERRPAYSSEPVSVRLGLTEEQLDEIVEEYHQFRDQCISTYMYCRSCTGINGDSPEFTKSLLIVNYSLL